MISKCSRLTFFAQCLANSHINPVSLFIIRVIFIHFSSFTRKSINHRSFCPKCDCWRDEIIPLFLFFSLFFFFFGTALMSAHTLKC